MAQVKITQVKSTIDRPKNQKLTIKALGLGKINKSVEVNTLHRLLAWLIK
jgi:large subunit ribosomal protein L30